MEQAVLRKQRVSDIVGLATETTENSVAKYFEPILLDTPRKHRLPTLKNITQSILMQRAAAWVILLPRY
jgi:hypothetical protein